VPGQRHARAPGGPINNAVITTNEAVSTSRGSFSLTNARSVDRIDQKLTAAAESFQTSKRPRLPCWASCASLPGRVTPWPLSDAPLRPTGAPRFARSPRDCSTATRWLDVRSDIIWTIEEVADRPHPALSKRIYLHHAANFRTLSGRREHLACGREFDLSGPDDAGTVADGGAQPIPLSRTRFEMVQLPCGLESTWFKDSGLLPLRGLALSVSGYAGLLLGMREARGLRYVGTVDWEFGAAASSARPGTPGCAGTHRSWTSDAAAA
jgi:hypothetical protein